MSKSILIVEDEEMIREDLAYILKSQGYTISTANSGNEAQKKIESQPYDLIVTDLRMPDGSGNDLISWIKDHKQDLPIIVITGNPNDIETNKAEADGYILKPFEKDDVLDVVSGFLS